MNVSKEISLLFIINLIQFVSFSQTIKVVDSNVNENKGTFIITKIEKSYFSPKDSSEIIVKIYMPFWKQLKGFNQNSIKMFLIDSSLYELNNQGIVNIKVGKGWHKIGIRYPFDPPFSTFHDIILRFKKKKKYHINIYLPVPFPNVFH